MTPSQTIETKQEVQAYRAANVSADRWAAGHGPLQHSIETQGRIFSLAQRLDNAVRRLEPSEFFDLLHAADRLTSAGMWLVAHETYAQNIYLDGRELEATDFKPRPEGHTGGALNMVPAYAGYLAANALSGITRSWIMGQGHVVAAIDSLNLLVDNMGPAHAARYSATDPGLTRYVRDFYSYRGDERGEPESPLGSHVNPHTAGGTVEGGYLGFTELQYVHMPLPGERLVVFLSDGAFEEQRGSDWAPRWWRGEDSGLVAPIMISNGRRIDQRTTLSQQGGAAWLVEHLRLNSFDPLVFDGRDPAAFVWAILEQEQRLQAAFQAVQRGEATYPIRLPYGIAVAPKGAGFAGEGTNLAHNLPIAGNPATDAAARELFNDSAQQLWVEPAALDEAVQAFRTHGAAGRILERDHPIANRNVSLSNPVELISTAVATDRENSQNWNRSSPMAAVDEMFLRTIDANPDLRPRVGNPDEMRSNRLSKTLERLKFRVTDPELGMPEAIDGAVVTALNEEAVASAALGNGGGINLVATYEAFGIKMFGVMRQQLTWSDQAGRIGRPPGWLSLPLVLTSNTWENSKNEISHQDPSMAEAMLGELSHVSRVVFPADFNSAAVAMNRVYQTRGQIWTLVIPKAGQIADIFLPSEAEQLIDQGALQLEWLSDPNPDVILTAIGAYQLEQVVLAAQRLRALGVKVSVVYMSEPGRFRLPRTEAESQHNADQGLVDSLFPSSTAARVFVCHTRPELLLGTLQPLNTGSSTCSAVGFSGRGGTLDINGLLFLNGCSWAHIVQEAAKVGGLSRRDLLSDRELEVMEGKRAPAGTLWANPNP